MEHQVAAAFAENRPALLRHCYRMLGSFAEAEDVVQDTFERAWKARERYRGTAPISHWLSAIATNACLDALATRRRRELPQLESPPAGESYVLAELEAARFITPAPDARLFVDPEKSVESRETITLAFTALLQRLPPKQRAALLLKDVLGWPAEQIAETLELSLSSVNSALHRGRETIAAARCRHDEPPAETLSAFVRAWEERDLQGLVALLQKDVALAMPPYAVWLQGVDSVVRLFTSERFSAFWSTVTGAIPTRANGWPAFAFYRSAAGGSRRHALLVARFVGGQVAEMTVFIGAANFAGFDLPDTFDRTISRSSPV